MASIPKLNYYKKMKCANCNYSWDYPFSNRASMSDLQNLFYFEVHICPHCLSVGDMITEVGEFELQIQNDKQYKTIIKERNIPFSTVCKKEAYKYVLYAYICEKKNDDFMASKAFYMANKVEKYQRDKYLESMLYNEKKDAQMLKKSEDKESEYLQKSIYHMQNFVKDNPNDINANIMLAVLYKLASKEAPAINILNAVMKKDIDKTQIEMVKEVVKMELGTSNFLKHN
ncbi:MAG: hypothetical protein ACI4TX_04870 [Christensenellales bacterium]